MVRWHILFSRKRTKNILNRNFIYLDAREEKKARGALLSAVERSLSKDDIVIADALNYIKGFRYQLYCIARAIGTPHCVVQTGVPVDIAKEWNKSRGSAGYDETV